MVIVEIKVGINIAKGVSAEKTIEQMNMNAEGVSTSKSLYELAKKTQNRNAHMR